MNNEDISRANAPFLCDSEAAHAKAHHASCTVTLFPPVRGTMRAGFAALGTKSRFFATRVRNCAPQGEISLIFLYDLFISNCYRILQDLSTFAFRVFPKKQAVWSVIQSTFDIGRRVMLRDVEVERRGNAAMTEPRLQGAQHTDVKEPQAGEGLMAFVLVPLVLCSVFAMTMSCILAFGERDTAKWAANAYDVRSYDDLDAPKRPAIAPVPVSLTTKGTKQNKLPLAHN